MRKTSRTSSFRAMDLNKKIAVVTGGAQGIGLAIAEILLESGSHVVICDINQEAGDRAVKKLKSSHINCFFVKTDVSNEIAFKDTMNNIKSKLGQIHILVNNAAYIDDSEFGWQKQIDVNIKGTIIGCETGLRTLERGGVIINLSSVTAFNPYLLMPIYSMTKAAVLNLTTTLGSQFYMDNFGIRVMALLPGKTDTGALQSEHIRYMFPELAKYRNDAKLSTGNKQPAKCVAKCFIKALKSGGNGSLWVAQENRTPELLTINYSLN